MTGQTSTPDPAPVCAECGAATAPKSADTETVTHCEWCGAEYPVPEPGGPPAPAES